MAESDLKRVLLIAFHYPPVRVSSGIQRTLKFSRYLPEFGWTPSVLTAHPRAYDVVSDDQLKDIPPAMTVCRAFALDSARHLAIRGRYPYWLSLPDRWVSWWLGGVASGLRLIRRERPKVLWSTYPIATSHLIGLTLHRLTGIPWIADFRDSMTEDHYPPEPAKRRLYRRIESQVVRHCRRAVFTTPGAVRMYAGRYPQLPGERWAMIANGYDEENFVQAAGGGAQRPDGGPLTLVHSGILYPAERDPRQFFAALADLKRAGRVSADTLNVVLRASGHDGYHRRLLQEQGIEDLVRLEPGVPYVQALREMLDADGLLLFQAANCNHQIPAKLYEYLRARRPLLALTDPAGDTAGVLREAGIDTLVPLDDRQAIAAGLESFLERVRQGRAPLATERQIAAYSRYARTRELAALLDAVTEPAPRERAGAGTPAAWRDGP